MTGRKLGLGVLPILWLAAAGLAQPADAAANIGVAAAAQNDVQGVQGSATESLAAGSKIFQDEVIKTGAKAAAQLLFLDETSLSVGPQSQVTLDKFIYNPKSGAGSVVFSATKGAFRFITGTQASTNYRIDTAVATLAVRGTIVDGYLDGKGGLYVVAQQGQADGAVIVRVGDQTYTLKPGQALYVSADKTVTGPMVPDDQFIRVAGLVFPLYGGVLPGEHEEVDVPDGQEFRADDLFEHTPPDTDHGCECDDCPGDETS